MDAVTVYNEFIYSMVEQEELAAIRRELLTKHNSRELSGLEAARLLVNYELFTKETSEELHLAIMMQAERNGKVRRYIDFLISTMAEYLPRREELLHIFATFREQSSGAIYQTYCGWKTLYRKLQLAELTCRDLSALELAQELGAECNDSDHLIKLLAAFDDHEEICRQVDAFLDKPLTVSAPEKARNLTAAFINSLKVLKSLNNPLYYESLSQYATTTHGQASRGLSMLLSAERLFRLEEATGAKAKGTASYDISPLQSQGPAASRKKWYLLGGGALGVAALGLVVAVAGSGQDNSPAAAAPAVAAVAEPAAVAPAEKSEEAVVPPKVVDPARVATIFTTSSPGVKACAAGPMTSANCPESSRGFLNKGAQVTLLKEEDPGWCQVETAEGQLFWVFSGFLKGAEKHRKWLPVTATKEVRVFSDKKLTQIAGQLKSDTSACGRSAGTSLLEVATPNGQLGYVLKNRVNW